MAAIVTRSEGVLVRFAETTSIMNIAVPDDLSPVPIATLGPAGTSSEAAACHLREHLCMRFGGTATDWPVVLHGRYELAGDALRGGTAALLVVANAYHGVSEFYMDPGLQISGAFVFDTPLYGIAAAASSPTSGRVRIASHPAPIPLIHELLDSERFDVAEIIRCDSTSEAAATVAAGKADLALTTAPASELHELTIISRARSIRMLWSIFAGRNVTRNVTMGVSA